ncbi:hypothetical protein E1B28_000835 [Marasmius oreades]|uniref:Uncharacterized protein n=1 Tax=Marasmius oreades TaxID=181124 RepID=A0A9P7V294_9AGAR|nr:uncharacterized protein E1B28_000835 [Marasmius oreades]KAG7098945.1 hypothetical protein E1B28_000835 [Marasmius oreades]
MDDLPYTTPEEDPFSPQPLRPRRRRSSMLDKWIQEQQRSSVASSSGHTQDLPNDGNLRLNPYLAYPDLSQHPNPVPGPCQSAATLDSYDVVDEEDLAQAREESAEIQQNGTPSTPLSTKRSTFLGSPSSTLRHLHISLRPSTPNRQSPSRIPFLGFGTPTGRNHMPKQHNRSSSLSTLNTSTAATSIPDLSPPTRWRPSVLGFFSSPTTSQVSVLQSDTLCAPSRPSMSSSNTATTTNSHSTVVASEEHNPPSTHYKPQASKTLVSSIRLRRRSHGNLKNTSSDNFGTSSPQKASSLRVPFATKGGSLVTGNLPTNDLLEDDEDEDDEECYATTRPGLTRPQIAFAASTKTIPRVSFASLSSRNQKKKKLVVSGIATNDVRKFEGAKRWCESFGEVSQIVRMPNGDLHVHFRSAEVADTVCRLRAKVYIAGVGSVNLSWYTGNKR